MQQHIKNKLGYWRLREPAGVLSRTVGIWRTCGYRDRTPTEAHFSHMKKMIGEELRAIGA